MAQGTHYNYLGDCFTLRTARNCDIFPERIMCPTTETLILIMEHWDFPEVVCLEHLTQHSNLNHSAKEWH